MKLAIDQLPYLEGLTGERKRIGLYPAGLVLMLVATAQQGDIMSGRVQREYAKIQEAKMPKAKR